MSRRSRSGGSGRSFGSSSVALPQNRRSSSAASCHRGGAVGNHAGVMGNSGGAVGNHAGAVGNCGGAVGNCGGAVGNRGPCRSSSRSLDGSAHRRPTGAAGQCSPPRCGHGVGAAGTGMGCRSTGFGYGAGGAPRPRTITPVAIKEQPLQPLCPPLDANVRAVKHREKEQIKTLNNKFASFINQVRLLEQQNKVLETKWSFLRGQTRPGISAVPALDAFTAHLRQQLGALGRRRARLQTELNAAQQLLQNNRKMYKDERSRRPRTESEFIALKKDAGRFFLNKAELEAKLERLKEEVEFLQTFYEEQTRQLRASASETPVVVQMDNSRDLDSGGIAADVRAQYEDIARRSRAEAQAWYESKFEELRATAGRNAASLQEARTKIAELTRSVQALSRELRGATDQRRRLEDAVADAERRGEAAVGDAKHKLAELQTALQRSRAQLARQLREFRQLSSLRLGLDVEIVTYKKLLEGEESRLCAEGGFPVSIPVCHLQGAPTPPAPGFASAPVPPSGPPCRSSAGGARSRGAGAGGSSTGSSLGKAPSTSEVVRSSA